MFCSLNVQFINGIVVDHSWDGVKRFAELTQDVLLILTDNPQVHERIVVPGVNNNK